MKILIQKRPFHKREFEILDSKLRFKESRFGNENELYIPYENILGSKSSFKKTESWFIVFGIFFTLLTVLTIVWYFEDGDVDPEAPVIWGCISLILFYFSYKMKENSWRIGLINNESIMMFKNRPNEMDVEQFFNELIEKRNSFLLNNYGFIDRNLSYERQYNNLEWLRSRNVLTPEEFEERRQQLKALFEINSNRIGFDNLN
ncbi:hypothetical protein MUU74_02440 [Chryseobacterium daecheongense]|uniref:hypothetical protein n=1 Tax=Chryseobacterium daecheongense TaxID=192389 RepID=UPI001FD68BE2|nr:hypothetical protein [Chryseobacterium daecheongense]UOU98818.1 hypothetical protein MUU74_02440 [Chryseobacterium daecheongense]